MIIKCAMCGREFDTPSRRNQHQRNAHPEGAIQYILNQAAKKDAAAPQSTAQAQEE